MRQTRIFPFIALALIFVFGACEHKPVASEDSFPADTIDTVAVDTLPVDHAFYGVAGDFGMSSFVIITDQGDTIEVTRTADDGTEGVIYGDAQPGERYYLLTTPDKQSLVAAINLTQLNRFVTDYIIVNGRLVFHPENGADTVTIDDVTDERLLYHTSSGERKVMYAG